MVERKEGLNYFTAIRRRRSIREFTGEKIPDEDIERIIDTARYAPSPENFQNVRYVLIRKDEDLKKTIADICQEASGELFGSAPYELTQGRLWYTPELRRPATFKDMRDGSLFRYPEKSDSLIVCCASESYHDSPLIYPNEYFGSVTLGMAVQSMWTAASTLGYGVGYQAFPVMEPRRAEYICDEIGIPRLWKPISVLCIGVPIKPVRMVGPSRWPLEGFFFEERWGNPYVRKAFRKL